jgi:hypothetical protein
MTKPVNREQMVAIARRMGYKGPMSKFGEFLMSSPKQNYSTGGLVTDPNNIPVAPTGKAGGGTTGTSSTSVTSTASTVPTATLPAPNTNVTPVVVNGVEQRGEQFIPQGSGQLTDPLYVDPTATAEQTKAAAPTPVGTATYDASLTQPSVEQVVGNYQYATGTVDPNSTVQGQMSNLMQDFEDGTPAWAAGAMRAADAQSLARGLGSSSMAAAATTQAAMEAALPIAMQDANAYLQMQFLNMNNEQQALMLANQTRTQALFTDAAAENAAKQFNATSENQTRQFNESLKSSVEMFNAEQANALEQFNAGQKNAMTQFKASLENDRQKFNASNQLIVDQANAKWRQEIATINNANVNEANRINAQTKADITLTEMNAYHQERRDVMNYAYQAGQNDATRATELLIAQMSLDEVEKQSKSKSSEALWKTVGAVTAEFLR